MRKLVIAFLAALLLGACVQGEKGAAASAQAPDFTLQDLDGRSVSLSGLRGKVVILDFWATWCLPCREAIPEIERLYSTYAGKGLVVLGISLDEGNWNAVKSFRDEYGITYPILKGDYDIERNYMVRTIPMLVIVDREGNIRRRYIGGGAEEEIEKEIRPLLDAMKQS